MPLIYFLLGALLIRVSLWSADFIPAPQEFRQEIAIRYDSARGLPKEGVQIIDRDAGVVLAFGGGRWFRFEGEGWEEAKELGIRSAEEFVVYNPERNAVRLAIPWREVRQVLRADEQVWVRTEKEIYRVVDGGAEPLGWGKSGRINQMAADSTGALWVASETGLFSREGRGWSLAKVNDGQGRAWGVADVLGVAFDGKEQLWFAVKAGIACRTREGWKFYEGKDGLPWNDFTGVAVAEGAVWFGTKLGAIRFEGGNWHYRQGPGWLPDDHVTQITVGEDGRAWFATPGGLGTIAFKEITLAEKAGIYEEEIARYIKRTPYGFVAEAPLRVPGERSTAQPNDSDNDGLWTAMYGAGECFAYAATGDPKAKARAKQAFEALRFLQKVTEGGSHAPPKGYIARTILPTEGHNPNEGRIERDRAEQKEDRLWKAYEPRWPTSADGKWHWKSDTSSDELDGHYFFYPLYFEFCAEDDLEKERVREVVRGITDHLMKHDFNLIEHDGLPTRWGIYSPKQLNHDPDWWSERGLKSLSILSYLEVAAYITGDAKYSDAALQLINEHGYAHNFMFAKAQQGAGSGNQSDDEMAVMCYYNLLRYSKNEPLKAQARYSFYRYWVNEAAEMNPFFNFAYAAHNRGATVTNVWGAFSLDPWEGWMEDAMATLRGFPLDRLNWPRRNDHRLDVRLLTPERSVDLYRPRRSGRGHRVNGKVLPVENRHFNHWNTDPWRLNYGGNGGELAAGTVFLLPYYMGLYHGFIEKPARD